MAPPLLGNRREHSAGSRRRGSERRALGSTSVPGLAAKPIIDVLLTVADLTAESTYVPALELGGFVLRVNKVGHRMLRTPTRDVHVHVYEPDRPEVLDHLTLRDWLRVDAGDRALYAETKRRLAQRQWNDMNDYADAKTPVIQEISHPRPQMARGPGGTVDSPIDRTACATLVGPLKPPDGRKDGVCS